MKNTLMCIVRSEPSAQQIVAELQTSGFTTREISVVAPDKSRMTPNDFAASTERAWSPLSSINVSGIGALMVSGPILRRLRETSSPSSNTVIETLTAMGVAEPEAKAYEARVRGGWVLVALAVETQEQRACAERIYRSAKAEDIFVTKDNESNRAYV